MEDFIQAISNSNFENDEKVELLKLLVHASVGKYVEIKEGFFLKVVPGTEGKEPKVELWCKRKQNGKFIYSNTHFTNDTILQMFHQKYLEDQSTYIR